jgi:hypothetical protein
LWEYSQFFLLDRTLRDNWMTSFGYKFFINCFFINKSLERVCSRTVRFFKFSKAVKIILKKRRYLVRRVTLLLIRTTIWKGSINYTTPLTKFQIFSLLRNWKIRNFDRLRCQFIDSPNLHQYHRKIKFWKYFCRN